MRADRIAAQLHRQVFAAHGFTRRGRECERRAGGLRKTLTVLTCGSSTGHPRVQLLAVVAVADLPAHSLQGSTFLPPDLLADATTVAGPALAFLEAADGLAEFVLWAQDVFAGDTHPGWWGHYRPVLPQGTGPLMAATFAAAMLGDAELVEFLTARVRNESRDDIDDFLTELRQLSGSAPGHVL